jgi:hypothetical protein
VPQTDVHEELAVVFRSFANALKMKVRTSYPLQENASIRYILGDWPLFIVNTVRDT